MRVFKAHLGALVMLWSALALADDGERQLSISVGDWPPFFVASEPGQGTVARLVRDIFAAEGYEVTFHFLPWKRAYREAANGKHDATAIWMYTADRQKDFLYSEPVMNERFVLFYRKDTPIEWNRMQDLANLKLGGSIGYSYGPEFDNAIANDILNVEWVASTELNFRRLLFGRIDAFPEEINVGYYILRRETDPQETGRITHHPEPILENQSFLLFPANEPETQTLREVFNRRLQVFRKNGRYDTYFETKPQASLNKVSK
ncbi:substrate-binding periplasmic protein [Marinobacter sp.]|uniref:substrate-binding periplasmic protein n=1 Tax=Marinobacter sp. TaxID=50741 RepID=UPI003B51B6F1